MRFLPSLFGSVLFEYDTFFKKNLNNIYTRYTLSDKGTGLRKI